MPDRDNAELWERTTDQLNRRHTKRIKLQRFGERKRGALASGS
jgi:hypothetical protein